MNKIMKLEGLYYIQKLRYSVQIDAVNLESSNTDSSTTDNNITMPCPSITSSLLCPLKLQRLFPLQQLYSSSDSMDFGDSADPPALSYVVVDTTISSLGAMTIPGHDHSGLINHNGSRSRTYDPMLAPLDAHRAVKALYHVHWALVIVVVIIIIIVIVIIIMVVIAATTVTDGVTVGSRRSLPCSLSIVLPASSSSPGRYSCRRAVN